MLSRSYLEVTVHDAALVQIADGLQHLLNHSAGVLLRVHSSVQDAVEQLTAGNPETTPTFKLHPHFFPFIVLII